MVTMNNPLKQGLKLIPSLGVKAEASEVTMNNPLKQGLKQPGSHCLFCKVKGNNEQSIKTRIKTTCTSITSAIYLIVTMNNPLKQGLKLVRGYRGDKYKDGNNEQSIKTRIKTTLIDSKGIYFLGNNEQSIKTRIKTVGDEKGNGNAHHL